MPGPPPFHPKPPESPRTLALRPSRRFRPHDAQGPSSVAGGFAPPPLPLRNTAHAMRTTKTPFSPPTSYLPSTSPTSREACVFSSPRECPQPPPTTPRGPTTHPPTPASSRLLAKEVFFRSSPNRPTPVAIRPSGFVINSDFGFRNSRRRRAGFRIPALCGPVFGLAHMLTQVIRSPNVTHASIGRHPTPLTRFVAWLPNQRSLGRFSHTDREREQEYGAHGDWAVLTLIFRAISRSWSHNR